MGKPLAWALLVLLTAAGGGVLGAVYFAVLMGGFDAVFGAPEAVDAALPSLGEKVGISAFAFGVPAGAMLGGLLVDEGFRKDDSWTQMIPSFIVIAAVFVFCFFVYFSQDRFGLIATYKALGYFAVLGLFAIAGWLGKRVLGQR